MALQACWVVVTWTGHTKLTWLYPSVCAESDMTYAGQRCSLAQNRQKELVNHDIAPETSHMGISNEQHQHGLQVFQHQVEHKQTIVNMNGMPTNRHCEHEWYACNKCTA